MIRRMNKQMYNLVKTITCGLYLEYMFSLMKVIVSNFFNHPNGYQIIFICCCLILEFFMGICLVTVFQSRFIKSQDCC